MSEGSILGSLGINATTLFGQIVNFSILLFILRKFVYGPVLKKLEERSDYIKKGMKAAEENIKFQEEADKKIEAKLAKASSDVEKVLTKAREDGKELYAQMLEKAKQDSIEVLAKEKKSLEDQFNKQRKDLESKVVDIAAAMTRKVLEEALDEKAQKQILEKQLKQLS